MDSGTEPTRPPPVGAMPEELRAKEGTPEREAAVQAMAGAVTAANFGALGLICAAVDFGALFLLPLAGIGPCTACSAGLFAVESVGGGVALAAAGIVVLLWGRSQHRKAERLDPEWTKWADEHAQIRAGRPAHIPHLPSRRR